MLKIKNVSKFYYNKGIIASGFTKVNLELKIGEFVVITGESGNGKSTLLNFSIVGICVLLVYIFNIIVRLLPLYRVIRKTHAEILARHDVG